MCIQDSNSLPSLAALALVLVASSGLRGANLKVVYMLRLVGRDGSLIILATGGGLLLAFG
jgi:hypothetical protein